MSGIRLDEPTLGGKLLNCLRWSFCFMRWAVAEFDLLFTGDDAARSTDLSLGFMVFMWGSDMGCTSSTSPLSSLSSKS
jgi:hypothetical protein